MYVKDDGSVLYSCVDGYPYTYTATMWTAYDISTASVTNCSLPSNYVPTWCEFSPDGTYFYCWYWYDSGRNIYQYTLSTPWDLTTASLTRLKSLAWNIGDNTYDVRFSPSWLKMYVWIRNNQWKIFQYNLSTAWDISTATYFGVLNLTTSYGWNWMTFGFCNNGKRIFAHQIWSYSSATWNIVQYDAS